MRSSRWIVAAIVLILVAGVWWVLRESSRAGRVAPAGAPPAAARPGLLHAWDEQEGAGGEEGEDASEPKSALLVRGVVVDEGGRPAVGAVVSLSSRIPRQVTTGPDGMFVFDGLRAVSYRVEAVKDDAWAGPVVVRAAESPDPVTLTLAAGSTLVVTVLDAQARTPIADAQVMLEGYRRRAKSGADGVARLTAMGPGMHRLAVKATGYAPAAPTVAMGAGPHAIEELQVLLQRGASVSGTIIDADGAPVADASVAAIDTSRPDALPLDFTRSDGGGAWTLPTLAAGTYRFTAMAPHHPAATTSLFTLDGRTPRTDVVIRFDAFATLSGRVLTTERAPVPGAMVRAVPLDMREFRGIGTRRRADAKGDFELPVYATKLLVAAESADAGSEVYTVDLTGGGIQRGLVIVLDRTGVVSGTVVTRSGDPAPFARIIARPDPSSGQSWEELRVRPSRVATADAAGRFTLKGLAGTCQLVAAKRGAAAQTLAFVPGTRVEAGQTGVRLVLAGAATVTGRVAFTNGAVPDPFSVSVTDSPSALMPGSTFRGTGGEFAIGELSPGSTGHLRVYGPGIVPKVVSVPPVPDTGDLDVGTIMVESGRALRGTVRDEHGRPVPGARVSTGHMLVGNGASLSKDSPSGQRAEAGADGTYELRGLGTDSFAVMAESPGEGRSEMVLLAAGSSDAVADLVLKATGALEGRITRAGVPVPAVVLAWPAGHDGRDGSPAAALMVQSGRDGSYRFDALAPGRYLVRTQRWKPPMTSMPAAAEVQITAGSTEHRDLELRPGSTLTVHVRQPPAMASGVVIIFIRGAIRARTLGDLQQLARSLDPASMQSAPLSRGADTSVFEDVPAGPATVCVYQEVASPGAASQQPLTCAPVVVGAEQAEATLTLASAP